MTSPFWYDAPAGDWTSALPIGNGRIGGMIFGGVEEELVLLNEASVWCGPPEDLDNPRGPQLIAQMRELLFAGKPVEAEELCEREFLHPDPDEDRCYQPLGFLRLRHGSAGEVTGYRRELDYDRAVVGTSFERGGTGYRREAFVSAPDQVMVLRFTADEPGAISFSASLDRPADAAMTVWGDCLRLSGRVSASGGRYPGVSFDALVGVVANGGDVVAAADGLQVCGADGVTLFLAVATDYDLHRPEVPSRRDRMAECEGRLAAARTKSFAQLKADHVADYQQLYRSSALQIAAPPCSDAPIDRRVAEAANGAGDPKLLSVYFAYCRYILISASRAGGMAMNLQGIWNPLMKAPWRSNWHLNINVQQAYWFAEQGNLAECHEPLFTLTENLGRNGQKTARVMLGTDRGFVGSLRTDASMYTAPAQKAVWGMYVAGGAWCAQHAMEHYRFTQDREFLAHRGLPILRANALFWVDWLVPEPKTGSLVSGPTASPENFFLLPDGRKASLAMGASHDQEIAWNSLRDFLEACRELGIDDDETREVQAAMERLALPTIAPDGRLREWPEDYEESEPGHRHLSHLWGMMPGNRITLRENPELAKAVTASLDYRLSHDYHAQGWSLGWVACMLARLKQGDRALELMTHEYFEHVWPNVFVEAHEQVQVGDMMGVPLAMIELVLQSHTGEIELLPALPQSWATGFATGLCARGGFVVDLAWTDGELDSAVITAKAAGSCTVRYGEQVTSLEVEAGSTHRITF
ncbi:glycoside hydrolase family 95 protein [Catenulispora rubra]|uniref:glycoside hydrolase family 95 protein n=1 Tax=Catenulispora rubra TaxID=280293 RepID=UPI001891FAA6|nr:glycoside hydrolase family 95 protein [Catenulispora rubra]